MQDNSHGFTTAAPIFAAHDKNPKAVDCGDDLFDRSRFGRPCHWHETTGRQADSQKCQPNPDI